MVVIMMILLCGVLMGVGSTFDVAVLLVVMDLMIGGASSPTLGAQSPCVISPSLEVFPCGLAFKLRLQ